MAITDWHHPLPKVDLAIARFRSNQEVATIPEDSMIPNHLVSTLGLGGDVAYVGILAPLDRPMDRTGTVGALDQERIGLDEYDYPAHLIDCRSYEGFSGSPVFALIAKPYLDHTDTYQNRPLGQMAYFAFLAGMFTAHLSEEKHWAPARYGVGVMLRSIEIRERCCRSRYVKNEKKRTVGCCAGDRPNDAIGPSTAIGPTTAQHRCDEMAASVSDPDVASGRLHVNHKVRRATSRPALCGTGPDCRRGECPLYPATRMGPALVSTTSSVRETRVRVGDPARSDSTNTG